MSDVKRVGSDILNGRPPKVRTIEPPEQEPKTEQQKEDTPHSKALGLEFDRACEEIKQERKRTKRLLAWRKFLQETPENLILQQSFADMRENMTGLSGGHHGYGDRCLGSGSRGSQPPG
jgi:hypothetical protein